MPEQVITNPVLTNLVATASNAASTMEDILEIKPPVPPPMLPTWLVLLLGALFVLLLGLVLAAFLVKQKRAEPKKCARSVPPHIQALRNLQDALTLLDNPEAFVMLVSNTVRAYLEARFRLRAPERTTEEFLQDLAMATVLSEAQKSVLAAFLQASDLVKFAKHVPARSDLLDMHRIAVELVKQTVQNQVANSGHMDTAS